MYYSWTSALDETKFLEEAETGMEVDLRELWRRNRLTVKKTIPVILSVSGVFIMIYDVITTQKLPNATPRYQARSMPVSTHHLINLNFSSSETVPSISVSLPDELIKLRPRILSDIPSNYSSKFKNPCYFDTSEKLHCLPYFLMIGAPKCGTTDIWFKIMYHPHIDYIKKEPHWWTRYSLRKDEDEGYDSDSSSDLTSSHQIWTAPVHRNDTLTTYGDQFFNQVILNLINGKASPSTAITGDGSASTIWQNMRWENFYPEDVKIGPRYIMVDVIRYVLPEAKIIISLREPAARLYSEYSAFRPKTMKSPEAFHAKVVKQIAHFSSCLTKRSLRSCAYGKQRDSTVRLSVGLYSLYITEWLQRYPRDQMMILTLEEWQKQCTQILPKIYLFLSVAKVSPNAVKSYCSRTQRNVNKVGKQPMLNSTRRLLRDFYRPYVEELALLLQHKKFLWDYATDEETHT